MYCCDYSAKYLYPTFRLAANDGGKSLGARNTEATELDNKGHSCVGKPVYQQNNWGTLEPLNWSLYPVVEPVLHLNRHFYNHNK